MASGSKINKTVAVAMSGGIDSSVTAVLVKKAYTKVIGVFLKLEETGNRCCSLSTEKRARQVADKFAIPFYVIHAEKEFKKEVIDYFIGTYRHGTTPNPCVVCNKKIKFGLLLNKVRQLFNADYLATGHYAVLKNSKLYRGRDKKKDQSYFLWQLTQEQLKHILFPVGAYTKDRVRDLAKKFQLPVTAVKESQETCFVDTTLDDFLKKHIPSQGGKIIDIAHNQVIGQHRGLAFYTLGQRRGLEISGSPKPFYVVKKNMTGNQLLVADAEHTPQFDRQQVIVENINWLSGQKPKLPLVIMAQIRYGHQVIPAKIIAADNRAATVIFTAAQRAVTPGQSMVFYLGEKVLGGGIISCLSV